MLGLLARAVIGVVAAAAVGGTAYAVYKLVTKDTVKEEVTEKVAMENPEAFEKMFSAMVKEKSENNEVVTVDVLDQWDEPLTEVEISGDEIASDINVGDKIILREAY